MFDEAMRNILDDHLSRRQQLVSQMPVRDDHSRDPCRLVRSFINGRLFVFNFICHVLNAIKLLCAGTMPESRRNEV